mgnify:CR=1 FL=1
MRQLTSEEVMVLERSGCTAQDWGQVRVADVGFDASRVRNVAFYDHIELGATAGSMAVADGFDKGCGIYNATLRNVVVGDHCLIENVRGYINNYRIGNNCLISNVHSIETTADAAF